MMQEEDTYIQERRWEPIISKHLHFVDLVNPGVNILKEGVGDEYHNGHDPLKRDRLVHGARFIHTSFGGRTTWFPSVVHTWNG
jgi:hypothetical protein